MLVGEKLLLLYHRPGQWEKELPGFIIVFNVLSNCGVCRFLILFFMYDWI